MILVRGTHGVRSCSVALVCALVSVSAFADTSAVPQASGIKLGEGRLHPYFDFDTRYDSLVGFFSSTTTSTGPPNGELILHFRPGVRFELDTPTSLVAFNGSGEYLYYTGAISPSSGVLSRFQANVALDTRFNRDGAAEVNIGDSLTRSDRTQNPVAAFGLLSLFNDLRLSVPIHPGGRAIEVTPKISWQVEFFDALLSGTSANCPTATSPGCDVTAMNYNNVEFGLNAKWKFLPKTAITLDAAFDWRNYMNASGSTSAANVLRVQAGLVGLISPRISVTLLAGYGGDVSRSNHNVIANAELAYIPSDLIRLNVGYLRTMQPVPTYGTFNDDRGYAAGRLGLLGGRLNFTSSASVDLFTFYKNTAANINDNRGDLMVTFMVGPTFVVTSWFDVGASYTLSYRTLQSTQLPSYVRHEVILRLTLRY